jgi:hypothetical protein
VPYSRPTIALLASLRHGTDISFECSYCRHRWHATEGERKNIADEIERRPAADEMGEWPAMDQKTAEIRKGLSVAYAEMEKANEKSLRKAAFLLKVIENSLWAEASPVVPIEVVSGVRNALGVGRISFAQEQIASAIRMIDSAGGK